MICPICEQRLAPNDKLVAEWFEPKQWWVLRHYKNYRVTHHDSAGGETVERQAYCGQANHPAIAQSTDSMRWQFGEPRDVDELLP